MKNTYCSNCKTLNQFPFGNNVNIFHSIIIFPSKCFFGYIFEENGEILLFLNQYRRF